MPVVDAKLVVVREVVASKAPAASRMFSRFIRDPLEIMIKASLQLIVKAKPILAMRPSAPYLFPRLSLLRQEENRYE